MSTGPKTGFELALEVALISVALIGALLTLFTVAELRGCHGPLDAWLALKATIAPAAAAQEAP